MKSWKQQAVIEIVKAITLSTVSEAKKDAAIASVLRLAEDKPRVTFTPPPGDELPEINEEPKTNNDDLATEKESQMLENNALRMSVTSKPRKDGRYQGYIVTDGEKTFYYGRTQDEVKMKLKYHEKMWLKMEMSRPTRNVVLKEPKVKKVKAPTTPIFADFVQSWIEKYKAPNLKPTSLASLKQTMRYPIAAFGGKEIAEITSDDVQTLLVGMNSLRVRDMCKINLSQCFKKAVTQGIIRFNPCDAVELKKHKAEKKKALTIEEQERFLSEIEGSKYELLYRTLLATGMRIGEALALTRSDVDFDKCTVSVTKNVVQVDGKQILQDTPKTQAGNRTIPLPEILCRHLRGVKTTLLFPYSYNAVRIATERLAKSMGIELTLHILRHTYATRLEEAGIPPKVKQYLLGHASLDMTQNVYTDTQMHYVESVSDSVRALF